MRVTMTGDMSGTRNGQPWPARGEEIDLPDDEGASLCASGMATPVADKDKGKGKTETRPGKDKPELRDADS